MSSALNPPAFTLDEPGTIVFTSERAYAGRTINRFALSLRVPENRQRFLDNPVSYMKDYNVTQDDAISVRQRDWTALLLAGAHLQAVLKLAATVGAGLWDIGAHNVGVNADELKVACPRRVSGLPESIR
ncbi:hypothetical protein [Paraburkholderia domus]|uniref:hypothetical protein n=1 Tax=Paraburkholderia domus TaxID=2793075 RepID=UPI0019142777|nr:hypothetical protein [Paraburkholderia domus]MBK5065912.1 hypothetical protein [Burkholderia sp. R-70199]CAE6959383.1 hypothetical protein R70199_07199 [Paraburkholderia domus]